MLAQAQVPPRFAGGNMSQGARRGGSPYRGHSMPVTSVGKPGFEPPRRSFSGHTQNQLYDQPNLSQADYYRMQQAQLSFQLESMKLQSLEMQERLMAAVQQQQQYGMGSNPAQPQNFVDPRGGVHNAGAKQQRPADFEEYHNQQSRREAVAAAQRGQLRRSPSPDPFQVQHQSASTAAGAKRANRLSFNGAFGDQLAEHAIARKASGGAESHPRPDFMEQGYRSHTRGQASISSVGSGQSVILSEERRELVSPQGPAILLSSPEDSFPISSSVTAPVISTAAPFAGSAVSDDDSAGSSGSQSPDLESAASSTTSLGSISSFKALNPGAASFTPLPPVVVQPARPSFSASAPTKLTVVLRQPKGPVKEEELGTRNFEGRRRKQALKTLKRRSFTPAA